MKWGDIMSNIMWNTGIGFFVGIVGTGLGGALTLLLVNPNKKFLSFLLGSTGGLMLSIVAFDLLPEANELGGMWIEIIGIVFGIILVLFIENIYFHISRGNSSCGPKYKTKKNSPHSALLKTGLVMGFGIAIHNLPEGLAIGSGFMLTQDMGIRIAIIIALHNIPEGIAMATPLRISGFSKIKIVLLALACGIPTGIGAFIGAFLGSISNALIAFCLSFAGGTMLYITCGEIIPSSKNFYKGRTSTIGVIFGFIIGIVIVN